MKFILVQKRCNVAKVIAKGLLKFQTRLEGMLESHRRKDRAKAEGILQSHRHKDGTVPEQRLTHGSGVDPEMRPCSYRELGLRKGAQKTLVRFNLQPWENWISACR